MSPSEYTADWVPDTPVHFSAPALLAGDGEQTQGKKQPSELGESFDIWNRLEKIENCPYLSWAGFAMVTDCLIGSYISFHFSIWFRSLVCNSLHPCWAGIRGHLWPVFNHRGPGGEWNGFHVIRNVSAQDSPFLHLDMICAFANPGTKAFTSFSVLLVSDRLFPWSFQLR